MFIRSVEAKDLVHSASSTLKVTEDVARENYDFYLKLINTKEGSSSIKRFRAEIMDKDYNGTITPRYLHFSWIDRHSRLMTTVVNFYQTTTDFEKEIKTFLKV